MPPTINKNNFRQQCTPAPAARGEVPLDVMEPLFPQEQLLLLRNAGASQGPGCKRSAGHSGGQRGRLVLTLHTSVATRSNLQTIKCTAAARRALKWFELAADALAWSPAQTCLTADVAYAQRYHGKCGKCADCKGQMQMAISS